MTLITLKCQTPNCKGSLVLDRDQYGNICLKCYLCERPVKEKDFRHLIEERNAHGYTNGGRPVKQGKRQYGHSKVKGK